jgi:hypothetical protein
MPRPQDGNLASRHWLWDTSRLPTGERMRSFTRITTPPNELCAALTGPNAIRSDLPDLGFSKQRYSTRQNVGWVDPRQRVQSSL